MWYSKQPVVLTEAVLGIRSPRPPRLPHVYFSPIRNGGEAFIWRDVSESCSGATTCPTLCDPVNCSMLGFPVLHCLSASVSFPMSLFLASGGLSFGASASASVLPINIQDWFPLWLTGLISLPSKGLSRVFSNTTVQKHQSFSAQPSLWSNSHIHTWLLENHSFDYIDLCQQSDVSGF